MTPHSMIGNYLNNHYEGMTSEQLILLLYKGAIDRLKLTIEGIEEKNIKKKGENLSKAIAIISELNASVDTKMNDEVSLFLRGLYNSILMELPKVSISNDTHILQQTKAYISKLKEIWEKDVMPKGKNKQNFSEKTKSGVTPPRAENFSSIRSPGSAFGSIAV